MRTVLAVDPGPTLSAWIVLEEGMPVAFGIEPNDRVIDMVYPVDLLETEIVVERMQSFGMPVGAEVFETCYMIGRVIQAARPRPVALVSRLEVTTHHCHSARAKDSNVRQAMLDRFGPGKEKAVGTKADPGPLHGIKKDIWSALAIGVYHLDTTESPDVTTGSTDLMPDPEGESQVDQN